MAKVQLGLGSMFSGRITKELLVQRWKGITYIRAKPYPRYQNTARQIVVRRRFAAAVKEYQTLDDVARMLWRMLAKGTGMSGYEYFLKKYITDRV